MAEQKRQAWMKLDGKMVELKSCLMYYGNTPMPGISTHDAAECVGGGPNDGAEKFVVDDEVKTGQHIYQYSTEDKRYHYKGVRS